MDDLAQLIELWKLEQFPWEQLEKRLTEFQLVENGAGRIAGAWGIRIAAQQALIHSEVFLHSEESDALRTLLWERIQTLVHNHGLVRLWTSETAPYFHNAGFHPPSADQLKKLPAAFQSQHPPTLVIELRAETETPALDIDKEFELFKEQERLRTEQAFKHARTLKTAATILAGLLFLFVLGFLIVAMKPGVLRSITSRPGDSKAPATNVAPAAITNPAPAGAPGKGSP